MPHSARSQLHAHRRRVARGVLLLAGLALAAAGLALSGGESSPLLSSASPSVVALEAEPGSPPLGVSSVDDPRVEVASSDSLSALPAPHGAHAPASASSLGRESADSAFASELGEPAVGCTAELRSWIVSLRGRHMYLHIDCPSPFEHLSGRVEYTTVLMRPDYDASVDESPLPVVGRMARGSHIRPPAWAPPPDNRLEAEYELTPEQARCLQRDVIFSTPYQLLGSNSSSGLRAVMERCGLELPAHVVESFEDWEEFPGVAEPVSEELDAEDWPRFGLPNGPRPLPIPFGERDGREGAGSPASDGVSPAASGDEASRCDG